MQLIEDDGRALVGWKRLHNGILRAAGNDILSVCGMKRWEFGLSSLSRCN